MTTLPATALVTATTTAQQADRIIIRRWLSDATAQEIEDFVMTADLSSRIKEQEVGLLTRLASALLGAGNRGAENQDRANVVPYDSALSAVASATSFTTPRETSPSGISSTSVMATAAAPAPIPTGMFLRDRARRHSATAPAQGVSPRLPVETTMPRPASASGDIRVRANQQLTGLLDDMRRRSQPTDTLTRLAARAIPRDLVCPMGFAQIALRVHEAGRFPGVFAMPPYLESQRPNELIVCLEIVELGALLKIAIGFQRARQNNDKDHFGICYVSHQNYDLSLVDGLRMILEAIDSTREFDHCQKISIFVPSRALLAVVRSAPWHLLPSTRRQTVILLTHTSDAEPNSLKKRIRVMAASPGNDSRELQNITRARVGDLIEQAHVH